MARTGARSTQSQSQSQDASQRTQKGKPSASQRKKRVADDDDDSEDEVMDDDDDDEEGEGSGEEQPSATQAVKKGKKAATGGGGSLGAEELRRCAGDLVRLAIFTEQKKATLKRADINSKVLPDGKSRQFPIVFAEAQKILKSVFGMELVELMSRQEMDKLGDEHLTNDGALVNKKKASTAPRNYVLRSCLHPELIRAGNRPIDVLKQAELNEIPEDQEQRRAEVNGSILGWEKAESIELAGLLQIVLCLILVNGRSLPDGQLRNQMKNFFVHPKTNFRTPAYSANKPPTFEEYLGILHNQGYLQRNQVSGNGIVPSQPAPTGGRRKSGRRGDDDDSELAVEWKWGARAHAEMSEMGVAMFMVDFMKERWLAEQRSIVEEDEEDAEAERGKKGKNKNKGPAPAQRTEELEKKAEAFAVQCMKDIIRDAGGDLTGSKEPKDD